MNHPTDMIVHTIAFVTPVVENRLNSEIVHSMQPYWRVLKI